MANDLTPEQLIERFERQPWRPIPSIEGGIPTCCLPNDNSLFVAVLFRWSCMLMHAAPKSFINAPKYWFGRVFRAVHVTVLCVLIAVAAVVLELTYRSFTFVLERPMRLFLWLSVLVLVIGPSYLLVYYPEQYNAFAAFLLNIGLCAVSIYASARSSAAQAKLHANDRWLPQAESACDRLLTLQHALKCFQLQTKHVCEDIGTYLPELREKKNNSVRALLQRQCNDSANRLQDFVNQVTSLVGDWRRFIRDNCQLGECETIFQNLDEVSTRLNVEYETAKASFGPGCGNDAQPVENDITSATR